MKIVFLALIALTTPCLALTVGKVDLQKAVLSTKEGQKVRDKLKGEFEKKKKIIEGMEDKLKKGQEELQKQSSVLSEKAMASKRGELQQVFATYQAKSNEFQKEMREMEKSFTDPILEKMKPIVEAVSKEAKVDVTFEVSASPLLFAEKEVDLTDTVIKEYDKKHK